MISLKDRSCWMSQAAARAAADNSASPLESEMTSCVVEPVSSTDSVLLLTVRRRRLNFVDWFVTVTLTAVFHKNLADLPSSTVSCAR